jgi:hypothetical protein
MPHGVFDPSQRRSRCFAFFYTRVLQMRRWLWAVSCWRYVEKTLSSSIETCCLGALSTRLSDQIVEGELRYLAPN